jgi:hypothetical protein
MPYTKRSPRRNSWAGRDNLRSRKAGNITRYPAGGAGIASSLGKMISADSDRNPSFFAFFRSVPSNDEGIQPRVYFFVPFLTIFDQ